MTLLSPWALFWLLSLPLLVTFYLFRPEPKKQRSTTFFLWKQSLPESQGGVFARQLRGNPLLLLQLLVLILLTLCLARPATSWVSLVPKAGKIVLVVDTSASMKAGSAFQEALDKADLALDGLFGGGPFKIQPEVMLIAVHRDPVIVVPFTNDLSALRSGLAKLEVSDVPDQLANLRPFFATLVADQKATVWLISDHLPKELEIPGVQFSSVGHLITSNVAVVAFSVEVSPQTHEERPFIYARLQNFSKAAEQRIFVVDRMNSQRPDTVETTVFQKMVLLPAESGQTVSQAIASSGLSPDAPSLFRVRLLPMPGTPSAEREKYTVDDIAFSVSPPFGSERLTVALTPGVGANFLLRALSAVQPLEVVEWKSALANPDSHVIDLLITTPNFVVPRDLEVRTRFEVSEAAPDASTPVEVLQASNSPLVAQTGTEWSHLRVQRTPNWPAGSNETVLLSTESGPALTLRGVSGGLPTLAWHFPLSYSSLPLSPVLPILVGRFVKEYSQRNALAIRGSLTTSERRARPAGAAWRGQLEIQGTSGSSLAQGSLSVAETERFLPRLQATGFYSAAPKGAKISVPLAVNLFSVSESALPHTSGDRTFHVEDNQVQEELESDEAESLQYREAYAPLLLLGILLLFLEAAWFLKRGRP